MATPISYGIGISDQNLQAMLNSDTPEIRQQAEAYLAAAQKQQTEKTGILQKLGDFFFPPAAGAEPDFNVITGEPINNNIQYYPGTTVPIATPFSNSQSVFFQPSEPSKPYENPIYQMKQLQGMIPTGIMTQIDQGEFTDDAGYEEDYYEDFPQKFKPGLNIDFAKQLGASALGLISGNPVIGLIARGLGALGDRFNLPGVVGGADLRGDTGLDTFRRSTSFADFFQRRRDQQAREEAAARGLAKQQNQALQAMTSNQAYSGNPNVNQGGNGGGGHAGGQAAADAAASQAADDRAAGAGGYFMGGRVPYIMGGLVDLVDIYD
jgi:hypothetical protein